MAIQMQDSPLQVETFMAMQTQIHPLPTDTNNQSNSVEQRPGFVNRLEQIWDKVGKSDHHRYTILQEVDKEVKDLYMRKEDQENLMKELLQQELTDSRTELTDLLSTLKEDYFPDLLEKPIGTLQEQLAEITPVLEKLRHQKKFRFQQLCYVRMQINHISRELSGNLSLNDFTITPEDFDGDLSITSLNHLRYQLQQLRTVKEERIMIVKHHMGNIIDLCAVLDEKLFQFIHSVNSTLAESATISIYNSTPDDSASIMPESITLDALAVLNDAVQTLIEEKTDRLKKFKKLGTMLTELWNLMDTPPYEKCLLDHVTRYISASVDEVTAPCALSMNIINQVEKEVGDLQELRAMKIKELVLKKQKQLELIHRQAHMSLKPAFEGAYVMAVIDSGHFECAELLESMNIEITRAKEDALSRKEILKMLHICLDAFDVFAFIQIKLKNNDRCDTDRANFEPGDLARVLLLQIPERLEILLVKIKDWEQEHSTKFTYDGVPLLQIIDTFKYWYSKVEGERLKNLQIRQHYHQRSTMLFLRPKIPSVFLITRSI